GALPRERSSADPVGRAGRGLVLVLCGRALPAAPRRLSNQVDELLRCGNGDSVPGSPPENRTADRIELRRAAGGDVLLHGALHRVEGRRREVPERVLVDLRALGARDGERLLLSAHVALIVANRAERPVEGGRREGHGCEERKLRP